MRGEFAVLGVLLLLPTAAASSVDFQVDLRAGQAPEYSGPTGLATLSERQDGERYAWNLTLSAEYTVGEIRIHGAFDVERAPQIVPEVDGRYLAELHSTDLRDVDEPGLVYNYTGAEGEYVLRVGLPGPGSPRLVLSRDVVAPTFVVDPVRNVTHYSFLATTQTNEYALADLLIRRADRGEEIRNPTPQPARQQSFPIQGLHSNTTYEWYLRFWDWSENAAQSEAFTLRTLPKPDVPGPVFSGLKPAPDARLDNGTSVEVSATYEDATSRVDVASVRLFFDAQEVHQGLVADATHVTYRPPPLAPGKHRVAVELRNEDGGQSVARWAFYVEGGGRLPGPGAGLELLALGTLLGIFGRRGPAPGVR